MSTRTAIQTATDSNAHAAVAACEHAAERVLNPSGLDRLAARLHAAGLDRRIAAGADPASSPRLAARAAVLAGPEARVQIAEDLERLLGAAEHPRGAWTVRPHREAVTANRAAVRDVVDLLRGPAPLYVRGMAALCGLLRDGTGPAYVGDADRLAAGIEDAHAALQGARAAGPMG